MRQIFAETRADGGIHNIAKRIVSVEEFSIYSGSRDEVERTEITTVSRLSPSSPGSHRECLEALTG
jgi:hypothetical protein